MTNLYAVSDRLTAFGAPFLASNDAEAQRGLVFALSQAESIQFANAGDYDLYQIGEYDERTGTITAFPSNKFIANGAVLVRCTHE